MSELNLLTQRLFAEGWTKERHPDYVCDWDYTSIYYGGFQYTAAKLKSMVFETPCGLLVQGYHWSSGGYMGYMGVDWSLENDNPTINCPFRQKGCALNHPLLREAPLGGGLSLIVECACHETAEPYAYERSIDKIRDDRDKWKEALFQEFAKGKHICRRHCRFDEHTDTWSQVYDPMDCAHDRASCRYCTILDKELDTKKGNIYFDLKTTRKGEDRGLLTREFEVSIQKDKRLLEHAVSVDICNAILKLQPDAPQRKAEDKYSRDLFFAEYHGRFFQVEAINIRVQTHAGRDLLQDLADIQAGYTVTHEADTLAAAKAQKAARRQKSLQARIRKAKKLILLHGLDGIDPTEAYRVNRLINKGLISLSDVEELELQREQQQGIEQLSLF